MKMENQEYNSDQYKGTKEIVFSHIIETTDKLSIFKKMKKLININKAIDSKLA